jgi:hypothetical protein
MPSQRRGQAIIPQLAILDDILTGVFIDDVSMLPAAKSGLSLIFVQILIGTTTGKFSDYSLNVDADFLENLELILHRSVLVGEKPAGAITPLVQLVELAFHLNHSTSLKVWQRVRTVQPFIEQYIKLWMPDCPCWSAPSPWHVTWPIYGLAAPIQYYLCATPSIRL